MLSPKSWKRALLFVNNHFGLCSILFNESFMINFMKKLCGDWLASINFGGYVPSMAELKPLLADLKLKAHPEASWYLMDRKPSSIVVV